MITYRATLDVPRELAWFVAKLLLAERWRRGTPRDSRALSCFWQAVLGLRWHVTASPSKIGGTALAALVLTHFEYGYSAPAEANRSASEDMRFRKPWAWTACLPKRSRTTQLHPARFAQAACGTDP